MLSLKKSPPLFPSFLSFLAEENCLISTCFNLLCFFKIKINYLTIIYIFFWYPKFWRNFSQICTRKKEFSKIFYSISWWKFANKITSFKFCSCFLFFLVNFCRKEAFFWPDFDFFPLKIDFFGSDSIDKVPVDRQKYKRILNYYYFFTFINFLTIIFG
jgi:hypothetical protein